MVGKVEDHEVAKAAFELWVAEGRPDGRSEEHWHRAKAMLEARETFEPAPAPAPKKRAAAKPAKADAAPAKAPRPRAPRKPKTE